MALVVPRDAALITPGAIHRFDDPQKRHISGGNRQAETAARTLVSFKSLQLTQNVWLHALHLFYENFPKYPETAFGDLL